MRLDKFLVKILWIPEVKISLLKWFIQSANLIQFPTYSTLILLLHIYESACIRQRIPNRKVRDGTVTASKAIVADTLNDRLACKGLKGFDDYFKHV